MALTEKDREKFEANPAQLIVKTVKDYIVGSPGNRFQYIDGTPIFDEPLVGFADGDDALFYEYKKIIGDFHLTPREALTKYLQSKGIKDIEEPAHVSVIAWILPIVLETRLSLRKETAVPSLRWNHTRVYGEPVNKELQLHLVSLFNELGHRAVAPMYTDLFKVHELPNGLASNWSQRHAAYAAGLGTFSLSDGFITPRGIAMRVGSVVVDMALPPTPRLYENHLANCLFYRDGSCRDCIKRCPAGAITEKGHDKIKCRSYIDNVMPGIMKEQGRDKDYVMKPTPGCGMCQTDVPCESRIPPASRKC